MKSEYRSLDIKTVMSQTRGCRYSFLQEPRQKLSTDVYQDPMLAECKNFRPGDLQEVARDDLQDSTGWWQARVLVY